MLFYKAVGFSRKDHAKTVLNKNFIIDIDYKIEKLGISSSSGKLDLSETKSKYPDRNKGGRPIDNIMLTVNTFKNFV